MSQLLLRRLAVGWTAAALGAFALTSVPANGVRAASSATTVQMSVATGGFAPGWGANNQDSDSERRLVSDDGRYVVFASSGPVVPGQKQLDWQIVRRDRQLGVTTLISKSSSGVKGNGRSGSPSISADGQVIAFHSDASNLAPGDTNGQADVFVHDARTGKTVRASVTSVGAQVSVPGPGTNIVGPPSISANGRYVGFTSHASGLAPGDTTQTNAYLHDLQTRTTEVVSKSSLGAVVDAGASSTVSVSSDGKFAAFYSGNANVVPGDTNGDPDVFVRDRSPGGSTTMIPAGQEGAVRYSMSANGRYVAFESASDNLTPGDTNGKLDIFLYDRSHSSTKRVSVGTGETQANGDSRYPAISGDGRYVAFESLATNLVNGDTNGQGDVFRHDTSTGKTIRVSVAANGSQNPAGSRRPAISGNGQHVVFASHARTLTPVDTSGYGQIYVRDLAGKWPALFASIGRLPAKVNPKDSYRINTRDIRTGPALAITWKPGKGALVHQNASVGANAFTLRAPKRHGKYVVTVRYADNTVGSRTIKVLKPGAKKLPKVIKVGKKLKIKTVGVKQGQRVQVHFKPARGKAVNRKAKVNKKGVARVKVAPRKGAYQVQVRSGGKVLRKGAIRIR